MAVRSPDREAVRVAATSVLQVIDGAVATLAGGVRSPAASWCGGKGRLCRELIADLLPGDRDDGI
jgi:hypothetical protein